jgi:hypothetical protein
MSYYFRPPNSREQNLFIIRFSVNDLYVSNFTNDVLKDSAYSSPSKIFLPSNFSLSYDEPNSYFTIDYTSAKYEIPPSINIQVKDGNLTELPKGYAVSIISTGINTTLFYLYYNQIQVNPDLTTNTIPVFPTLDVLLNIGIQVQIIGRTKTGPTFAIANQGWTYVESTDPTQDTIYSSMNVGTKGVVPPFGLTMGGSFGYFGGGGNGNTSVSSLENYSVTDVVNNFTKYTFFPIKLESTSETLTLPVVGVSNIGQEIILLLNQNTNTQTLTIAIDNTNLLTPLDLNDEGDTVKFIALAKDGVASRWVKVNNL